MISMLLPLAALFIDLLVIFMFFSKKYQKNVETRVYSILILINFLECILNVFGLYYISNYGDILISTIIQKVDISMMVIYAGLMLIYVYIVSLPKNSSFVKRFIFLTSIISTIIILIVPCHPIITDTIIDSEGASPIVAYITILIYAVFIVLFVLYSIIKDRKNIKNKKYIPLYALIALVIFGLFLRRIIPQVVFEPFVMAYVVLIMYHTIENPDMKMIEQLNIAKDHADKANRAKSEFLSSMSHEIRTPLNAIVGFSECILQEDDINDIKRDASDVIMASQNLLEIVNGILDISKIEANKMEIVETDYEFLPSITNIAKLMIPRIGEKPIELNTNFAVDIPYKMHGDIGKIKQIITNILTNAVKYTEQGYINFNVNCVNENDICSLVISIEDTGRGIKEDKIDKLFTKFDRLEEDKNTTIEGTGLGLAITKNLTDMLGGKIVVQSKYGEGSRFTVYLKQKIIKLINDGEEEKVENKSNLNFSGAHVLVVDDNKLNLRVADKILKNYSINTTLVESGFECIEKVKNNKYDLILLDIMMPKLNGIDTLSKLKELGLTTPIISLTANALSGERDKYMNLGFSEYLSKPIEKIELEKILTKFLSSNENSVNMKVLVVDDNSINIKVAENFLRPYKFDVESVLSGDECINKVKNNNYDIIFMDDMMPKLSGVDTLNELKKINGFDTPVVALTANALNDARGHYLNLGFSEYIAKPIDKKELDRVIKLFSSNKKENIVINSEQTTKDINYLKNNGIDVDTSLSLLGDIETYNETLEDFKSSLSEKLYKLKCFLLDKDMENYAILVHSLKSDCKYLGFTKLAEISYDHEMESKKNNLIYIINNFNVLIKEAINIKNIIDKY